MTGSLIEAFETLRAMDPEWEREGLRETPERAAHAFVELTAGYNEDPADVLKCFTDGGESYDEMVVVRGVPFYSLCEHHMLPFFGSASIGYIPNTVGNRILGLSKLVRLFRIFAARLQVQERLTYQVAFALAESELVPEGVGVTVQARHMCMEMRGVHAPGSETVTSCLLGAMRRDPSTRAEFLGL